MMTRKPSKGRKRKDTPTARRIAAAKRHNAAMDLRPQSGMFTAAIEPMSDRWIALMRGLYADGDTHAAQTVLACLDEIERLRTELARVKAATKPEPKRKPKRKP